MNWTLDATLGVIYTRICRLPKRVLWLSTALYMCNIYYTQCIYNTNNTRPTMRCDVVKLLKFCSKFFFLKKNIILIYNNKKTSQPSGRCSKINFKKTTYIDEFIVCAEIRHFVIFKGYCTLHLIGVLLIKFNFNFKFGQVFILNIYNSYTMCVFRHSNGILIELKKIEFKHIMFGRMVFVWERNYIQTCTARE